MCRKMEKAQHMKKELGSVQALALSGYVVNFG